MRARQKSKITDESFNAQIETTYDAITADIAKFNAAGAWIALALCEKKSIASGRHKCCAKSFCSSIHFQRMQKDSGLGPEELFHVAKRPRGLRDELFDEHPVVVAMRDRMQAFEIPETSDPLLAPETKEQIRPYSEARFPFLFDSSLLLTQQGVFAQGSLVAEACRHVLGWTFDDVVELFEWAWDHKKPGGAGRGSFARLWARDLTGFLKLYPFGQGSSGSRVNSSFDPIIPVLEAVLGDLFELERLVDCLAELTELRKERRRMSLLQKIVSGGLLSPLQISITQNDHKLLRKNNHIQHTYVAGHVGAAYPLKSRHLSSDLDKTEAFFVGWDDLDYSIHVFIGINGRRKEVFKKYKTAEETSLLQSRLFRLALNLIAATDPERAKEHFIKRLSEENRSEIAAKVSATNAENLSLFEISIDYGLRKASEDSWADADSETAVENCLEYERPGATYVTDFKSRMSLYESGGLRSAPTHSTRRAFYFREGWTALPSGAALKRARKKKKAALARLNRGYISERDESRLLETSLLLSERMLECVLPPLTSRDFAILLDTSPTKKSSNEVGAKNGHNPRKPASGRKSTRKKY